MLVAGGEIRCILLDVAGYVEEQQEDRSMCWSSHHLIASTISRRGRLSLLLK
jgi:hypothetical protein